MQLELFDNPKEQRKIYPLHERWTADLSGTGPTGETCGVPLLPQV